MSNTLTNEEKLSVVNQHIKSVDFSIYGVELDLIEENASSQPNAEYVTSLNQRLSSLNAKKSALTTEAASLTE